MIGSAGTLVGGRYRIDTLLGRGGMGVVWSGLDTLLERPVALKEIHLPPAIDDDERARYKTRVLREARAAARLNHRSVVAVYDVVDEGEQPYIVMELVPAPSLAELVERNGPLPPVQVAAIGLQIADALHAAHLGGIVHRDVKPANVLVPDEGPPRLTDFGIASIADDTNATTQRLIGSPSYMSPEQASNGLLTEATDRWSLGATLYLAVEGVPPFDRGEAIPTLTAILHEPPRPMRLAGSLTPLLADLLVKEPTDRPDDEQLHRALTALSRPAARSDTVAIDASILGPPTTSTPLADVTQIGDAVDHPAVPATDVAAHAEPVTQGRPDEAPDSEAPARLPASSRPPARLPRRRALALVVALLATIAGLALARRGGSSRAGVASPTTMAPSSTSTSGVAAVGAAGKRTTSTTAAPAVPASWVAYRDPDTGFAISHPPDWTISTRGTQTDIRDPASGAYLRVDHISPPHSDAAADWRSYEPRFAAANPGYQRIQITPATFQGFPAATWEYTYTGRGTPLRAVDLGFIVGSSYGFALNFQTPAATWDQMQPQFQAFKQSFKAPPG